ncbi:MAG: hypothetical protein M3O65_15240, partial [Actinomycetota bacterium]|nr:hypothetical protein [Actinomycetota bacterium]
SSASRAIGPGRAPAPAPPAPALARAPSAAPAPPALDLPVGSVADPETGLERLSTTPAAAVAGVVGGALLLAGLVAAGFRARARLGRLG